MRNHRFKKQEDVIYRIKFGHIGLNRAKIFHNEKKNMHPANVNVKLNIFQHYPHYRQDQLSRMDSLHRNKTILDIIEILECR